MGLVNAVIDLKAREVWLAPISERRKHSCERHQELLQVGGDNRDGTD